MAKCDLCAHEMKRECWYGSITSARTGNVVRLCHAKDHDCYQRWIEGERPQKKS